METKYQLTKGMFGTNDQRISGMQSGDFSLRIGQTYAIKDQLVKYAGWYNSKVKN